MVSKISIQNFKSIDKLEIELGRLNVFIGANGSGKSNLLEGIAMGAAGIADKLEHEFLSTRIRVTSPKFMMSAFESEIKKEIVEVSFTSTPLTVVGQKLFSTQVQLNFVSKVWSLKHLSFKLGDNQITLNNEVKQQNDEHVTIIKQYLAELEEQEKALIEKYNELKKSWFIINKQKLFKELQQSEYGLLKNKERIQDVSKKIFETKAMLEKENAVFQKATQAFYQQTNIKNFLIYAPENHFLRNFNEESQIRPLGLRGEGLFNHIAELHEEKPELFAKINEQLRVLDWFDGFEMPNDLKFTEKRIRIKDNYLQPDLSYFDQRSANEGFLYLLFYFTLFVSDETPSFFAIDNIDNAMNPKLGRQLVKTLAELAKQHQKQAILTTHNPAILDGLNLDDDEQRLFVVYRNADGQTRVRRIFKKNTPKNASLPLSEMFLRGYLGGLPNNF